VHSLSFSFGPCLEILDVSYNDITKLTVPEDDLDEDADSPSKVYPLKSLDISHAKLSSIDDLPFHRLTNLQVLKLDYNSFRSIPDSFSSLTELRQFSCSNNVVDAIPPGIGNLQKLEKINVQHNNLSSIPSGLWLCGALESLNATSNLLRIWHDYSAQENEPAERGSASLEARKGSMASTMSSKETTPLALSLQRLYLGDNKLDEDVFHALRHLKQLRTLNLCFNEIQEIPRWYFPQAVYLQELFLSGNKLTSIPTEDLHRMSNMRALYLNGNKLVTLPAELGKIKTLEILDVGSNLLKYNINNWEFDWNWYVLICIFKPGKPTYYSSGISTRD
jgi:adenylate cyclase